MSTVDAELHDEKAQDQIVLGVLDAVDRDPSVTQRSMARELDIALGLTNAYLKRCILKGLIKVSQVPARRYAHEPAIVCKLFGGAAFAFTEGVAYNLGAASFTGKIDTYERGDTRSSGCSSAGFGGLAPPPLTADLCAAAVRVGL